MALTSSRTCSYEGGGELGIVCSFLTDKQFLSVSGASANSSVPDGNDWLICRFCSSDSTLLLRLSPELRDFSIFEKRSLNGASLTNFFVLVALWKGRRSCFHLRVNRGMSLSLRNRFASIRTYPRIHADIKWNVVLHFEPIFKLIAARFWTWKNLSKKHVRRKQVRDVNFNGKKGVCEY